MPVSSVTSVHKLALFVERQEERLKTNNRDLSMASDAFKCVFRCCLLLSFNNS